MVDAHYTRVARKPCIRGFSGTLGGFIRGVNRQRGFDQSALCGRGDTQFAAEFANALAHAGDADARSQYAAAGRETVTFIANAQKDVAILDQEINPSAFAAGVAVNVGET